jgi:hypothetical protein
MRSSLVSFALALALLLPSLAVAAPGNAEVGDPLPTFAKDGHDSRKLARPTVYLFLGTTCPASQEYAERIRALDAAYAGKVDFVYLYPNNTDKPEDKQAHFKRLGLKGRFIDDTGAKIAGTLKATRTTEAVVADKTGKITYRGAIDDNRDSAANVKQRHLAEALDATLAGKPAPVAKTAVHA